MKEAPGEWRGSSFFLREVGAQAFFLGFFFSKASISALKAAASALLNSALARLRALARRSRRRALLLSGMMTPERKKLPRGSMLKQRAIGFEPTTSSLGSWHSTTELRPQFTATRECIAEAGPMASGRRRAEMPFAGSLVKVSHRADLAGNGIAVDQ